jgi:single-stranded DNA-binding protein
MIDCLISGKLIRAAELKTSQNGKPYCNFLMSVHIGEPDNTVVSGIAFGQHAELIAKLGKGDAVCAVGALKPTEWADKNSGETRHGLSVTVNNVLSVYDIKKRRPKPETPEFSSTYEPPAGYGQGSDFDDGIPI